MSASPDTTEACSEALIAWVAADFPPDDIEREQAREGVRSILAADRKALEKQGYVIVRADRSPLRANKRTLRDRWAVSTANGSDAMKTIAYLQSLGLRIEMTE
jgi:hypothetical protein